MHGECFLCLPLTTPLAVASLSKDVNHGRNCSFSGFVSVNAAANAGALVPGQWLRLPQEKGGDECALRLMVWPRVEAGESGEWELVWCRHQKAENWRGWCPTRPSRTRTSLVALWRRNTARNNRSRPTRASELIGIMI